MLKSLRDRWIVDGASRNYANTLTNKVFRIYKWGVSHELAKVESLLKLKTLEPLRRGKTIARENEPVSPWSSLQGNANDLQKEIAVLKTYEAALVEAYSRCSKKSAEEIRKLMEDETWWTGKGIVEHGFGTEMVGSVTSLMSTPMRDEALSKLNGMQQRAAFKSSIAIAKAKADRALRGCI